MNERRYMAGARAIGMLEGLIDARIINADSHPLTHPAVIDVIKEWNESAVVPASNPARQPAEQPA